MNYRLSIQQALDFIESNLDQPIDLDTIASATFYSKYHFHRLFHLLTGETVGNYIRKRRLTEAMYELKNSNHRILDVAVKFQFDSQESFCRAFKQYFKITPSRCRDSHDHVQLFPKHRLPIERIADKERREMMNPEFTHRDSFSVIGILYYGKNEENEIHQMWKRHAHKVLSIANRKRPDQYYGFCFQNEDYIDFGAFSYMIAVEIEALDSFNIPMDMVVKSVPAHEYAVFHHHGGPSKLGETYQYIEGEWLPKQPFKRNDAFDFEFYQGNAENESLSIYIPIIRG